MNKNEYYKLIHNLYEAAGTPNIDAGMNGAPVDQANIADTGADVMPQGQSMEPNMQQPGAMDPTMQDPNMMGIPPQEPQDSASDVMSKEKSKQLYNHLLDLISYTKSFVDSTTYIGTTILDAKDTAALTTDLDRLHEMLDKMSEYSTEVYINNDYPKNLYAYILFRTELLAIMKEIRSILKKADTWKEKDAE